MNAPVKIRLLSFKSFRHYGGREITTKVNFCQAVLIDTQSGYQKYIVELLEDCAGFKKGHKIAISENDYNL